VRGGAWLFILDIILYPLFSPSILHFYLLSLH
jgi:hypothetical protein